MSASQTIFLQDSVNGLFGSIFETILSKRRDYAGMQKKVIGRHFATNSSQSQKKLEVGRDRARARHFLLFGKA
jgi:hypothetical protein